MSMQPMKTVAYFAAAIAMLVVFTPTFDPHGSASGAAEATTTVVASGYVTREETRHAAAAPDACERSGYVCIRPMRQQWRGITDAELRHNAELRAEGERADRNPGQRVLSALAEVF